MSCEPCGNEECDRCYPQQRFVLRQDSVRRVRYEVTVKAASMEEALEMLADGSCQGAEPTSYNEHDLAVLSEEPGVALTHEEAYPDRDHQREYWLNRSCYHDLREARRLPDNLDEMIVALEAEPE
jgi:hypothetical protein